LQSLAGNFFKLKHLNGYLTRTVSALGGHNNNNKNDPTTAATTSSELFELVQETSVGDEVEDTATSKLWTSSRKAYVVLNETSKFLSTPCVSTIFKLALHEKRTTGAIINSNSGNLENVGGVGTKQMNNNNDENFSNMNSDAKSVQLKSIMASIATGSNGSNPSEEIRSPLNGKNVM
jgi:hypothetical protein